MSAKLDRLTAVVLAALLLAQAPAVPAIGQTALASSSPTGGAAVAGPNTAYSISSSMMDEGESAVVGATKALRVATSLGPNIVTNGNFEAPDVTSLTVDTYYAGQTFGGWSVQSGSVDHVSERYWQAAGGRQSVDLSGDSPAALSQILQTISSQEYLLQFALAGNPEKYPCEVPAEPIKRMEVWWDGILLDTLSFDTTGHSNWDMGWGFHQYTITATDSHSNLRFKSLNPSCLGPVLDTVSVKSYNGAIPLLDLPLDYTGRKFSDVALGNISGGWVNSWFDHRSPDYIEDQEVMLWTGKVLSDTANPRCIFGFNCYDGHNAIDYQRQNDNTIYAAAPGIVVDLCSNYPCIDPSTGGVKRGTSYGNWVLVRHGTPGSYGRYATFYAHLGTVNRNLAVGTEITDTKLITVGIMGGTGDHPVHLHFGVYYDADGDDKWEESYQGYTEAIDPYGWIGEDSDPWWNMSPYLWKSPLFEREIGSYIGAVVTTPSGKGKLTVSPGILTDTITIEMWDAPMPSAPSASLRAMGHSIWLKVLEWFNDGSASRDAGSAITASGFPQPVDVNIRYWISDTRHLDISQIGIFQLDETDGSWIALATSQDYDLMEASAQITSAGVFSLQAPLLCLADNSEPNDTYDASTFLPADGMRHDYVFDIEQDQDWFSFVAVAGGQYTFTTSNLSNGVATLIDLYDLDGETLLYTDDNSNGDGASQLVWRAPSSGTYFVRVYGSPAAAHGCDATYAFSLAQVIQSYLPFLQR